MINVRIFYKAVSYQNNEKIKFIQEAFSTSLNLSLFITNRISRN